MRYDNINNVRLGIFVILASLLLVVGIYYVGTRKNLFGSTFTISTVFTNAGGLQEGNNVRYAGINVGTVSEMNIITDSTIRLDLKLVERVKPYIKKNAVANLSVDGIVGSALVNITPGDGDAPSVEDGDEIVAANLPGTADLIATLGSTNENIALFAKDLLDISGKVTRGSGTLNLLLEDSITSNSLRSTMINMERASRSTLQMVQQLNRTVMAIENQQGLINQLIYDTTIIDNLREFTASLNGSVVQKLDTLIEHLDGVSNNLNESTLKLNGLLDDIKQEEGTLNKLIYDEEIAESLKSTLKNVEDGSAELKVDMEALRHNFLFRRYFRKLEKKANRQNSDKEKP